MRKPLKQFLSGLVELSIVFAIIFTIPALIACLINLDLSVYFSCIQHPAYCVVMSVISVISCIFYMSMYDQDKTVL